MKTLRLLLSVGAVVALLGLSVAVADMKNESTMPLTFPLDTGDGSGASLITFDAASGDEAQTTCATNPGGSTPEMMLPEPVIPEDADHFTNAESILEPASSLDSPPQSRVRYLPVEPTNRNRRVPGGENETEASPVPEPATLVLLGLGVGGVAAVAARRRWKKKSV